MLNEKLSQVESDNDKLKNEIISLKEKVNKRRKVECGTTPLQVGILEQQEKLYDVKMECFNEIKKMADKVKMVGNHLEIISQTYQRMRDLQAKIVELEEWRRIEKNIPSSLPMIKSYDITMHSMTTKECQDLAFRFEENAQKDLAGMMDLYERYLYDIQRYFEWLEINFQDEHPVPYALFKQLEDNYEKIKEEVQAKEIISREDIQELLVKPSMEYSHYTTFVHKFVISMEEYRKCNIDLDVKKAHIFNSREENILPHHEAWNKHFQKRGE